jgi:disulfide bond formation protein DsbB
MSVNTVSTFFAVGTLVLGSLVISLILLWIVSLVSDRAAAGLEGVARSVHGQGLWIAWLVALIATVGSLYYSEIAGFTPCDYCWYQRIAMYPLAITLGIAAFGRDDGVRKYVFPLAIIGGLIATYHYTIQHFPDLDVGSCNVFAPCSAAYVWKFDFVSIPLMALACFATIVAVLALDRPGRSAPAPTPRMGEVSVSSEEDQ